jgi:formylglycine-generating enzyme required for sulfatase activity
MKINEEDTMTSSIQETWFFRAATGAIRGPYSEDAVRGFISDNVILRETEIWTSLDNTKVAAGTSARFAGCFPQQIDFDPSDLPPGNAGSFGQTAQSCSLETGLSTYTNSIGMEFVLIPSGWFMMGSDKEKDQEALDDETPHRVTISKPFYLGKYEVTQAQWEAVMGSNPSYFKGRDNPVETVSWDDVREFIKSLNIKEGNGCWRLPTEAEWEYACRAGTTGVYSFGDDENSLGHYAWYDGNSKSAHPVGQKRPNAWGLYDMHGNVWEWVQDWYGEYPTSSVLDPRGPSSGSYRVNRGGSWDDDARNCRSAYRDNDTPGNRYIGMGFRLALSPE